jgi:predicted nuclease of predicted toxin-antitoxin system
MALRLLLDEDVPPQVAECLRRRGVDALSVYDVGRAGRRVPDDQQLAFATGDGRVLVTYNRADFQSLDARWRLEGRAHAGILWGSERSNPRRAVGELVRALEAMAQARDDLRDVCMPIPRPPAA